MKGVRSQESGVRRKPMDESKDFIQDASLLFFNLVKSRGNKAIDSSVSLKGAILTPGF